MAAQLTDLPRISTLGGLLKRIGNYDPKSFRGSFDVRLILQKTIYLMQAFGLYIGYSYSWYLRGPYSVELTREAYELADQFEKTPFVKFVERNAENRFLEFMRFLNDRKNDHRWLELVASIHFLFAAWPSKTRREIYRELRGKIPRLSEAEFQHSLKYLTEYGLLRGRGNS